MDTNGTINISETEKQTGSSVFARSGKLARSPVRQILLEPVNTQETPKSELPISKMQQALKLIEELYAFSKERSNLHHRIKDYIVKLKATVGAAAKEHQNLTDRAEAAERTLKFATEKPKLLQTPKTGTNESATPTVNKRRRFTPEDSPKGSLKKQRQNNEVAKSERTNDWRMVQRKEKKENIAKAKPEKPKPRRERQRGDALLVAANGETSYAAILRTVKADPALKKLGESVVKTRRTQKGEMLFELKKGPTINSAAFKELVEKSLGETAKVRALSQETVIECRYLDEVTTEEELKNALKTQFELGEAAPSIKMRKGYGGTQTATIKLPEITAEKLLQIGKVKVGWSVCPLRTVQRIERCFKCMGFKHHSRNCKGPDRSNMCRKCGESGHLAKDCSKPPKCMLCTTDNDHPTGCARCPKFKEAIKGTK